MANLLKGSIPVDANADMMLAGVKSATLPVSLGRHKQPIGPLLNNSEYILLRGKMNTGGIENSSAQMKPNIVTLSPLFLKLFVKPSEIKKEATKIKYN